MTTHETKHATACKLPLRAAGMLGNLIMDADDNMVASLRTSRPAGRMKSDCDYIVNAVNCHADLLAALKECVEWADAYTYYAAQPGRANRAVAAARAAIRKAEGGAK